VLLCIVGQFYKRAIAVNVETQDQVDGINHFLKGVLKVYIRPPKIVKKDEVATLLKRPSFVGAEAGKVIAHLEDHPSHRSKSLSSRLLTISWTCTTRPHEAVIERTRQGPARREGPPCTKGGFQV
jgi:hypothetical protein